MKRLILTVIAVGIFTGSVYAVDNLYVQSKKARIMSEPNFASGLEGWVKRGNKLDVLETGNGWYKISSGKLNGWINRLCVSEHPVMQKVKIITDEALELEDASRKRASAITSAAAARGLSDADRKRLSDMGRADYRSLGDLETLTGGITEKDVDEFMSAARE